MGYLLDEEGTIASELAVGAEALLALAGGPPRPREARTGTQQIEARGEEHGPRSGRGKANKGLQASRLNRSGLKAGTPAPDFVLPRVGGGQVSLEEHRGERVLLVFSDPECGPCDELAPHLEQLHRQHPNVRVLMISRRDEDANRQKIEKGKLTFPVALQRSWEISLRYGMFATPIAYLIDERGVLASDVTVGVAPIRTLMAAAAGPDKGQAGAAALQNRALAVSPTD
jgi:peroxiredoxin